MLGKIFISSPVKSSMSHPQLHPINRFFFFSQIRMAFATPEKTEQRVGGDF